MKRILTSVVLLVLLLPTLALGEKMDDLVITDGLHYKKFTDVPFTGEITGKVQGSFKKGKWDGPWVSYHDNGQLLGKGSYKDGKLDGPWVWYHDNGQLSGKGTWKDGKLDGPWVWYHDNVQLRSKGTYKDGNRDGPWVYYNRDGTVDEEWTGTFKDGVKVD
jgi:antitoxin component YwqK of YwqJK toxin-antitoxin module